MPCSNCSETFNNKKLKHLETLRTCPAPLSLLFLPLPLPSLCCPKSVYKSKKLSEVTKLAGKLQGLQVEAAQVKRVVDESGFRPATATVLESSTATASWLLKEQVSSLAAESSFRRPHHASISATCRAVTAVHIGFNFDSSDASDCRDA